jgi:hypothetical protein
LVEAAEIREELEGHVLAFGGDGLGRPDAPEDLGGLIRGHPLAEPARGEQAQQGVQSADRPGPQRDEVMASIGEQAQHGGVIDRPHQLQ